MKVHVMAGALLLLLAVAVLAAPVAAAEEYVFVTKWGSEGSGEGEFRNPNDVAVDAAGNIYVADYSNHRIQLFDSNENFLGQWGSYGSGDGQLIQPISIAFDAAGNVYVVEADNHRIQVFDPSGYSLSIWGSYGSGDGQFVRPGGIAVDNAGNFYVADSWNHRVQKFDSSGNFLAILGSQGSGDGQFGSPIDVAVDAADNIYVTDWELNCIQKFDSNGAFLSKWGSSGSENGQFYHPYGVDVDAAGDIYVTDWDGNRIQKFDSNGIFLTKWGSFGSDDGKFRTPCGITVDAAGNVYVADFYNNRIQKFAPIPIPTIAGIIPDSGPNTGPVSITDLSGTGFIDGATVKLTRAGEAEIVATDVSVVSSTQITCTLDLTGAAVGSWNVVVANPGGQPVTLADGFSVTEAANSPPGVTTVTAPTDPQLPGSLIQATGTFTDPDEGDSHTALWAWGDGVTSEGPVDEATGTVTGSHTYTAPGTYMITLTVTDSEGASGSGTATITVQTPAEATADLIEQVESLELPGGIGNGLTVKLDNAIVVLDSGNEHAASNYLSAFINQVKAQKDKKLTAEDADALIAMAQRIIDSI
ncbi:PKD domain-containing protein [Methanoculleus oceani]|uniref:PKD domain-containing protein n=1 Tax=Methanoculleus oceani TaxID=2184756 RepID=UPI0020335CC3|nr:PKD domain-containing protein [Methanoculleus sp. CWC-02]